MPNLRKQHIAIFGIKYFPSKGGTSRVVESLLQRINQDYNITIYCYQHKDASDNIPGIKTIQFAEPRIKKFGVFIYFTKCLFHLLLKGDYDLVHAHKTEVSFFIPFIRLKYPVIITSHEIPYLNSKWGVVGKIYFRIAEWLFMHAAAIRTSISQTQCEFYQEKYKRPVLYIPNGVSKPLICTDAEKASFRKKHDIKGGYLLFAARRIIPLKGCHHFIDALLKLKYQGEVVIAGDLDQMKEYSEELIEKSKPLNIKFVDYIASQRLLNSMVQDAKAFIFPSEIEGMSMMLLEVAILSTPIICSNIAQNQVIFSDDHVLYFRSKDPQDLSDKIQYALDHPSDLQARAILAKKHAIDHYGIDQVVDQYRTLYNQHLKISNEPAQ
jgi:glycosyltransferase involved in cell wall biosynthesis